MSLVFVGALTFKFYNYRVFSASSALLFSHFSLPVTVTGFLLPFFCFKMSTYSSYWNSKHII